MSYLSTYKAILGDVNELVIGTNHLRDLQEDGTRLSQILTYQTRLTAISDAAMTHVAVVGGRHDIFQLLVREDIDGDEVALRVTVLPSLRSRHFDHLTSCKIRYETTTANQTFLHTGYQTTLHTLTLQGLPLITRYPPLRMAPACWGKVLEAPASEVSK